VVDASAGFGDGVSSMLSFGLYSTANARKALGIDGGVNQCSASYSGGKYAGYAWGAATLGLGSTVRAGGKAAKELVPAAERATQIANTLGNSKRFITIGVTDTAEGVRIISSSENALRPAALNALSKGEIAVTGVGHAEVTGINAANKLGLTPIGTAASRGICPSCAQFLQDLGVPPLSPLK
jgi:hypothetical protein